MIIYKVQLDTLRAVAVLMVILSHWIPKPFHPLGYIGVQLFFVLSGYLITTILLASKAKLESPYYSYRQILKGFYMRRFLRILPLFYLTLIFTSLIDIKAVDNYIVWHALYLSNIKMALMNEWMGNASHFWSLAVEEQFYLFWPFIILFVPNKHLLVVLILIIMASPVFLIGCDLMQLDNDLFKVLPISSCHTLGAGALLAYFEIYSKIKPSTYMNYSKLFGVFALLSLLIIVMIRLFNLHLINMYQILSDFILAILLAYIVYKVSVGYNGVIGYLLSLKPLIYLGKISYGLYMLHNFIPDIISKTGNLLGINIYSSSIPSNFAINLTSLIILSSISWFLIEKRILYLKKFFPYLRKLNRNEIVKSPRALT